MKRKRPARGSERRAPVFSERERFLPDAEYRLLAIFYIAFGDIPGVTDDKSPLGCHSCAECVRSARVLDFHCQNKKTAESAGRCEATGVLKSENPGLALATARRTYRITVFLRILSGVHFAGSQFFAFGKTFAPAKSNVS